MNLDLKKYSFPLLIGAIIFVVLILVAWLLLRSPSAEKVPAGTPSALSIALIELKVEAQSPQPGYTVGQVVKFNYNVKNTGGVSAAGPVTITGAPAACPEVKTVGNLNDQLETGETITCTSEYTITQADLDRGSVTVVAIATVNGINSNQVTYPLSTIPPAQLGLAKTANPVTYDHAGQTITYTYVITNKTANPMGPTQFTVTDPGIGNPINCGDLGTTLAPNATVTCSASHIISDAEMSAASISTNATAAAPGITPSQPVGATVTKSNVPVSGSTLTSGSTVKHKVENGEWLWQIARCYGADPKAVMDANPQLEDPAELSPEMIITIPNIGSDGKIYKSADVPCVKEHKVEAADTWASIAQKYNADLSVLQKVNPGTLTVGSLLLVPLNSAGTSSATSPAATAVPAATTAAPADKVIALTAAASPKTYSSAGQIITYTYTIKNNGSVTLGPAQFTVTELLISETPFKCGAENTILTPSATVSCTATYSITQEDMGATSLVSEAVANGGGAPASPSAGDTITRQ